jgi:hypothetical protein
VVSPSSSVCAHTLYVNHLVLLGGLLLQALTVSSALHTRPRGLEAQRHYFEPSLRSMWRCLAVQLQLRLAWQL